MKMKTVIAAAVISAFAATASAESLENQGAYAFGSIGWSKAHSDFASELDKAAAYYGYNSTTSASEDSVGIKLGGGYRFNDYLAVEGAYYWLGESTYKVHMKNGANIRYGEVELNGYLLAVDLVGYLPVTNKIDLFGKAGFGLGIINADVNNARNRHHDDDGNWYYSFAPKLGFGTEVKLPNEHFVIRAEYEHIWNVGTSSDFGQRIDYDFVSVGFKYKF